MKESYGEGIAIHAGPESCGDTREGSAKASTGVHAGRGYSRESRFLRGADAVRRSGRPHPTRRQRETATAPARSDTPRTAGITMPVNRDAPGRSTPAVAA